MAGGGGYLLQRPLGPKRGGGRDKILKYRREGGPLRPLARSLGQPTDKNLLHRTDDKLACFSILQCTCAYSV